jgi:hypothetical protein
LHLLTNLTPFSLQVVASQGFQDACAAHTTKAACAGVDSDADAGTKDCTFTGPCSGPSGKTVAEACPMEDTSEEDSELAQKLGQFQPFLAAFPPECVGQLASSGPT